jgi:hypothetical protein
VSSQDLSQRKFKSPVVNATHSRAISPARHSDPARGAPFSSDLDATSRYAAAPRGNTRTMLLRNRAVLVCPADSSASPRDSLRNAPPLFSTLGVGENAEPGERFSLRVVKLRTFALERFSQSPRNGFRLGQESGAGYANDAFPRSLPYRRQGGFRRERGQGLVVRARWTPCRRCKRRRGRSWGTFSWRTALHVQHSRFSRAPNRGDTVPYDAS